MVGAQARFNTAGFQIPGLMVLVLTICLLLSACSATATGPSDPGSAEPTEATGSSGIPDIAGGVPTRDQALSAFEVALGDLNGYEPPGPPVLVPKELSTVIRWFLMYADTLPKEVSAAARLRFAGPVADSITLSPSLSPSAAGGSPPAFESTKPVRLLPAGINLAELKNSFETAVALITARTGYQLTHSIEIDLNNDEVALRQLTCSASGRLPSGLCPDRPVPAYTVRETGQPCQVRFNPSAMGRSTPAFAGLLIHEAWHCFQFDYDPGLGPLPEWINEGQAEWVEGKLGPDGNDLVTDEYTQWLSYPTLALFRQQYSAAGFYAAADDAGLNPLPRLLGMIGLSSELAYQLISQRDNPVLLQRWATTYANDTSNGPSWTLAQNSASRIRLNPPQVTVGNETVQLSTVAPYTADLKRLTGGAEVLHVVLTGTGRLSDRAFGGSTDAEVKDSWFCTPMDIDSCRCPNDEARDKPPSPIKANMLLARAGGVDDMTGRVEGMTVTDYCRLRTPVPQETECSSTDWLMPADVAPLAQNWNYQPTPCSLSFEYVEERNAQPPSSSRTVQAGLLVQETLGDFDKPNPPNPIPELGPRAHFPEGLHTYFVKNNISSAGEVVVFPCGRHYCVLHLSETTAPPDSEDVVRDHILMLARLVQGRARGR